MFEDHVEDILNSIDAYMSEMSNATSTGPIDLSSNIKYVHRFINEFVYYLTSRDVSLNNSRLFASLHSTSQQSVAE